MSLKKIKIAIAGIGGVGGYFGGLLAKAFAGMAEVEVCFIARGAHLDQIKKEGLKVIKGDIEFIAKPFLATDDPTEIGEVDYLIISTKSYDLNNLLQQLEGCINKNTVILPLLNGVEAVETIRHAFPKNLVPAGCAYIVSAIKDPGIVENMGNRQEIFFGLDSKTDERLDKLEDLLKAAGIEATLSQEISKFIWEKFIFLSTIATATSYYNQNIGNLLSENSQTLVALIKEVTGIALAKGIKIDAHIKEKAMAHYHNLPVDATSSMHRDYLNNKPQTELASLTGYVVKEAKKLGLETPLFNNAFEELNSENFIY